MGITGAPVLGTNATVTNTHGLLVSAGAVGAATNSYGLTVNAQTGATNNYAAVFLGGNVGISANAPVAGLDVNNSVALSGDISPTQITANQNDYNPSGLSTASVLRLSSDASRDITGLQGGADGRVLTLLNVGSNNIVLNNQSSSSTAGNRFALGADITIAADQSVAILYDSTSQRWRAAGLPFCGAACQVVQPYSSGGYTNAYPVGGMWGDGTYLYSGAYGPWGGSSAPSLSLLETRHQGI